MKIIENNELEFVKVNAKIKTVGEMIEALEMFNPTARILMEGAVGEWAMYLNPSLEWAGLFNSEGESVVVIVPES